MRLVIDTDVIVAAMRSPSGASSELLKLLLRKKATMLLGVALALEYEAICMMAEHRLAAKLSERDVHTLLATIVDRCEPVEVHYHWRPQLNDAGDEMVLEAAVNGRANAIVTFNRRDYKHVTKQFGIEILSPAEALGRLQK